MPPQPSVILWLQHRTISQVKWADIALTIWTVYSACGCTTDSAQVLLTAHSQSLCDGMCLCYSVLHRTVKIQEEIWVCKIVSNNFCSTFVPARTHIVHNFYTLGFPCCKRRVYYLQLPQSWNNCGYQLFFIEIWVPCSDTNLKIEICEIKKTPNTTQCNNSLIDFHVHYPLIGKFLWKYMHWQIAHS